MTTPDLRDRFAMAALTGWLANSEGIHCQAAPIASCFAIRPNETAAWLAEISFKIADAMMAERDRLASLVGRGERDE